MEEFKLTIKIILVLFLVAMVRGSVLPWWGLGTP